MVEHLEAPNPFMSFASGTNFMQLLCEAWQYFNNNLCGWPHKKHTHKQYRRECVFASSMLFVAMVNWYVWFGWWNAISPIDSSIIYAGKDVVARFRALGVSQSESIAMPMHSQLAEMRIDGTWIFDLAKSRDDFTLTPPRIRESQRDKSESHDRRRLERNTFRC